MPSTYIVKADENCSDIASKLCPTTCDTGCSDTETQHIICNYNKCGDDLAENTELVYDCNITDSTCGRPTPTAGAGYDRICDLCVRGARANGYWDAWMPPLGLRQCQYPQKCTNGKCNFDNTKTCTDDLQCPVRALDKSDILPSCPVDITILDAPGDVPGTFDMHISPKVCYIPTKECKECSVPPPGTTRSPSCTKYIDNVYPKCGTLCSDWNPPASPAIY
jgi:hypothetical protein